MSSIIYSYFWGNGKIFNPDKYMPVNVIHYGHELTLYPQMSRAQMMALS